jgi:hypothetical protein
LDTAFPQRCPSPTGEVYAIAKWVGPKAKEVRGKLGDGKDLPTLEAVKNTVAVPFHVAEYKQCVGERGGNSAHLL